MESLTLVPISTKLIEPSLLTDSEVFFMNNLSHDQVNI